MIDIQHRALRALKHEALAFGQQVVQHAPRIGNKGANLLRRIRILVIHLRRIQWPRTGMGTKQRMNDLVLLRAGGLYVLFQERRIQQVHNPQPAARHLVFIRRPNAPARGADLLPPRRALRSQLNHPVVGQNHLRPVRHK